MLGSMGKGFYRSLRQDIESTAKNRSRSTESDSSWHQLSTQHRSEIKVSFSLHGNAIVYRYETDLPFLDELVYADRMNPIWIYLGAGGCSAPVTRCECSRGHTRPHIVLYWFWVQHSLALSFALKYSTLWKKICDFCSTSFNVYFMYTLLNMSASTID